MRNRLPILLLVIAAGQVCACASFRAARLRAGDAPRGELEMMRQASSYTLVDFPKVDDGSDGDTWLEVDLHDKPDHTDTKVWAREDETVCQRDWAPMDGVGYVLFRAGTDKPVAYAGELGSCAKEPPLPARYRDHDQFRCAFPSDATVEVHSYAWPAELREEVDAERLSRRRARVLSARIQSTAIPNSVTGSHVHGTTYSQVPTSQGDRVIGVAFVVRSGPDDEGFRAPRFSVRRGPAISSGSRQQLETYFTKTWMGVAEGEAEPYSDPSLDVIEQADGSMKLVYRPWLRVQESRIVYKKAYPRGEFRTQPFVNWTEAVVEHGCDPSGIEPPKPPEVSE